MTKVENYEPVPTALVNGRFVVKARLGQGTRGLALLALDTLVCEEVVCKLPFVDDEGSAEALVAQYRQLVQMRTTHLAQPRGVFTDISDERSFPFLVLELVDGQTAAQWKVGKSRRARVDVLAKVAEALDALHSNGLAHGDVYEDNVMVARSGRVVLIDPDAAGFGSVGSRARQSASGDVQGDLQSLAALVRELLPGKDIEGLQFVVDRLTVPQTANRCSAGDVARELRSALARGSLPGETARSMGDLAGWSSNELAARKRIYRDIVQARTVAFSSLVDRIDSMARNLDLVLDRRDLMGAKELTIQRDVESAAQPQGNLFHRNAEVQSPDGDKLFVSLNGEGAFRKPWPFEDRPGLIGRGVLALRDVANPGDPDFVDELELHLDGTTSAFVAVGAGRADEVTDDYLLSWLKMLRRVSYSAIRKAKVLTDGQGKPLASLDPSPYRQSLAKAGVELTESPIDRLRGLAETMFSLKKSSGLDSFGAESLWQASLSKRPEIARNIGSQFLSAFGPYLEAVNWFEISDPSPSSKTLEVSLDVSPRGAPRERWSLKIEMVD